MAKKCRRCGYQNDDESYFCKRCGEPLDDKVRLLMDYERMKKTAPQSKQSVPKQDSDEDYVYTRREPKKKSHAALWIAAACLVVAAVVVIYLLLPH